jgi:hypothetical protein
LKKQPVRLAANWLPLSQARFPQAALLLLIEIRTRRERHAAQRLSEIRRAQRMKSLLRGDACVRVLQAILNGDQSVRIGAGDFWLSLKRRTDPPVRLSARKSAA